jgi:hypothetical protein
MNKGTCKRLAEDGYCAKAHLTKEQFDAEVKKRKDAAAKAKAKGKGT